MEFTTDGSHVYILKRDQKKIPSAMLGTWGKIIGIQSHSYNE